MKKILLCTLFCFVAFLPEFNTAQGRAVTASSFSMIYGFKTWDDYPHVPAPASYTVALTSGGSATMVVYGDPLDPDYIMVDGVVMTVTSTSHSDVGGEIIEEWNGHVNGTPMRYKARQIYAFLTLSGWYGSI
ncbi:hypothetical protein [Chitinophaga deserti]|uniref:hypothetical protein n=1 Tax=Chitinophaga deserti TaxID=2164099 RepID=UPI000D6D482C|nr:hypothetical protein [Chitinophaga deserti]